MASWGTYLPVFSAAGSWYSDSMALKLQLAEGHAPDSLDRVRPTFFSMMVVVIDELCDYSRFVAKQKGVAMD
jgi:hypothetical protein